MIPTQKLRSKAILGSVALLAVLLAGVLVLIVQRRSADGEPLRSQKPVLALALVQADMVRDDFQAAFERLEVLEESHPDDIDVQYWLGVCHRELGRQTEAFNHLLRVVKLDDSHRQAHLGLATLFESQNRHGEALVHLQRAVELNPQEAATQQRLGVAWLRTGELERAIATLTEAVRLAPDDADAHWMLGRSYQLDGDLPQAVKQLERAVELEPGHRAAKALAELR